ncbi:hypothetical protein HAALTHF_36150n [Vreelandella aquamarina]|nr:hypothetical protein HAALTHF_36150n [Halomonas axialensis]
MAVKGEGWNSTKAQVDFYDLKGDLESLLAMGGAREAWRFEPGEHPLCILGKPPSSFTMANPPAGLAHCTRKCVPSWGLRLMRCCLKFA